MSKIHKYDTFLNEEFFKKIFGKKPKKETKSSIDQTVEEILNFINENGIWTWQEFQTSSKFDREVIHKIIDKSTNNMSELKEIRFKLRLELSNTNELREWIKELEENEEYEKCALILKKINNR
jgi:hypothetical protein